MEGFRPWTGLVPRRRDEAACNARPYLIITSYLRYSFVTVNKKILHGASVVVVWFSANTDFGVRPQVVGIAASRDAAGTCGRGRDRRRGRRGVASCEMGCAPIKFRDFKANHSPRRDFFVPSYPI